MSYQDPNKALARAFPGQKGPYRLARLVHTTVSVARRLMRGTLRISLRHLSLLKQSCERRGIDCPVDVEVMASWVKSQKGRDAA